MKFLKNLLVLILITLFFPAVFNAQAKADAIPLPDIESIEVISVSYNITTPEGTFALARKDRTIESYPEGTKAVLTLRSTVNDTEVSATIEATFSKMINNSSIFCSQNGLCFSSLPTGHFIPFLQDNFDPAIELHKAQNDSEVLILAWKKQHFINIDKTISSLEKMPKEDIVAACKGIARLPHPHVGRMLEQLKASENKLIASAAAEALLSWHELHSLVNQKNK